MNTFFSNEININATKLLPRNPTPPIAQQQSSIEIPEVVPEKPTTAKIVDLSMFRLLHKRRLLPTFEFIVIIVCVFFAAFSLHVRFAWCRAQPIVVLTLLVCSVYLKRTNVPYVTGRPLCVYEAYSEAHVIDMNIAWHAIPACIAVWYAYGALFHAGRHAQHDLSLLDGVFLNSPGDIGSANIVPALRMLAYIIGVTYVSQNILSMTALRAYASFSLLLCVVPPLYGVAHTLPVHSIVLRLSAFILAFTVAECTRLMRAHWYWLRNVATRNVRSAQLSALNDEHYNSVVAKVRFLFVPLKPTSDEQVQRYELVRTALPGGYVMLSALQSIWILSVPHTVFSVICSLLTCAIILQAARSRTLSPFDLDHKNFP